jgi:hypothetical protein
MTENTKKPRRYDRRKFNISPGIYQEWGSPDPKGRPSQGGAGHRIATLCDIMTLDGVVPTLAEVQAMAVHFDMNAGNVQVEYRYWFLRNGFDKVEAAA